MFSASNLEFKKRAENCIGQGVLTNSKNWTSLIEGIYPTHVEHGFGCWLYDVEKRKYLDFICGLGANLFGYANPYVEDAVSEVIKNGITHSLPTVFEVMAAEKVKEVFTWVDRVKFTKTGTESCMAAVRMARAFTGRSLVLSDAYHGWSDDFVSLTPPAAGVPERGFIKKLYSDLDFGEDVAAVIVEPVVTDWSEERITWLRALQAKCKKVGAILIFDEIVTGLRWPKHSVSKYYHIYPDLICIGKSLAGGLPLSAVCGRKDILDNPSYFVSGTFYGEILSLNVARRMLDLLQTNKNYSIESLWDFSRNFQDKFNSIWPAGLQMTGYPTRGILSGAEEVVALFMQETCKAGILFHKSWFFNFSHMQEDMDSVLGTLKDIIQKIRLGEVNLEGKMPVSPFAQRVRNGH